jgi:hypothetical protein
MGLIGADVRRDEFGFGVGKRRNRMAENPHWCPLWIDHAEMAANLLGFEFSRANGGIQLRTAEQRDLVVAKAEATWRDAARSLVVRSD